MNRWSTKWSSKQDSVLIDFVRRHESLYNIKHEDYRSYELKRKLWNEIAKILNKTVTDCTKRWSYIRDYYVRQNRRTYTGSCREEWRKRSKRLSFLNGLPSPGKVKITYVGVEDANPGDKAQDASEGTAVQNTENQDTTNDNNAEDSNVDQEFKYDSSEEDTMMIDEDANKDIDNKVDIYIKCEKSPKDISHTQERLNSVTQILEQNLYTDNELDENDLFFSSMAKIVKRLPRYEQAKLRLQIGSLVGNVELRHLRNE